MKKGSLKRFNLDSELEEKEFHCLLLSLTVLSSVNFNSPVTLGALPLCLHKMGKKEDLGKYRHQSAYLSL